MKRRLELWSLVCAAFAIGWIAAPLAQGAAQAPPWQGRPGKANWLIDGGDPQKNAWQRNETLITKESVRNMKLAWKLQLDNQPRQMHNLFPPLIVSDVTTADGPKEIAIVAGISDNLYGIDVARGTQLWKRKFDSTFVEPTGGRGPGVLCPGGLTATPVIGPADAAGKYIAYVISWDGRLRKVDVATGAEIEPAEPFLPPNGKPYALNLRDNVLYTTTAQGCGGNPNAFYSYDLATKKVGQYLPGSGGMWPRSGPTLGKDGTLYAGSGDGDYYPERQIYGQSIIGAKQDPETKAMVMKDWFAPTNAFWLRKRDLDMNVTGPIFDWKGKEYLVQSSKECRLWLLDTAALGGEDHRTPVYRTPLVCNEDVNFAATGTWGALASWEDKDGTRYVLMPFWGPKHSQFKAPIEYGEVTRGAVAAFKLEEKPAGKVVLTPVWLSRDMDQAEPPVVAGTSVVFAYGSGENTAQADPALGLGFNTAANRIAHSTHATLYALDAHTGKELWSSGDQITSFNHFSGLSVANGRVYIGTYDGMLYCFAVGPGATAACPRRFRLKPAATRVDLVVPEAPVNANQARLLVGAAIVAAAAAASALHAQNREWTTANGDAQRNSWVRTDPRLTKDAVQKGEFKFLWKTKLNGDNRQLNSLTQPILLDRLISHRGFKALAFVGTSSERIFAIDTDLNRIYWEHVINYSSIAPPANSSWECPGGLTAAFTRPTLVAPPAFGAGRGGGRSGSSVGEPGRGAPSLQQPAQAQGRGRGNDPTPPAAGRANAPAAPAAPQGRGAPSPGNGGGPTENVFVLASDGLVRALNTHNGTERFPGDAVPAGECQGRRIDPGRRRALHRDVERLRIGAERRLRARRQRRGIPSPSPGRPVARALPAVPVRRWGRTERSTSPRARRRRSAPRGRRREDHGLCELGGGARAEDPEGQGLVHGPRRRLQRDPRRLSPQRQGPRRCHRQ